MPMVGSPPRRDRRVSICSDLGARETPQRRAVLDALCAVDDHPNAAEIYERVRARMPGVGAATVYRTLGLLVETGRARELVFEGEVAARYDANIAEHHHLVCTGCNRMLDVTPHLPRTILRELSTNTGYEISGYDLRFQGLCPTCAGSPPTTTHEGNST